MSLKQKIREWLDIEDREKPFIGEVYCGYFYGMSIRGVCDLNTICGGGQMVTKIFYRFTENDVQERRDSEWKIFNIWHKTKNIIIYSDGYDKKRQQIINNNKEN